VVRRAGPRRAPAAAPPAPAAPPPRARAPRPPRAPGRGGVSTRDRDRRAASVGVREYSCTAYLLPYPRIYARPI
jgi:hypothetical protein